MDSVAQPGAENVVATPMIHTGLSGNEWYCVNELGYRPGDLLIGNSVFSMGLIGGLVSSFRGLVGGEIHEITEMISEGRRLSLERFNGELTQKGAVGATGVSSELVFHPGNVEFLSIGSALHGEGPGQNFTSSSDGQELYCQVDAGYDPIKFVFGNVAYSIGVGRGLLGSLKTLARGEIAEFTDIFNKTRHLTIERISQEARAAGANSVVGIRTTILPFLSTGFQEMVMVGTASKSAAIEKARATLPGMPDILTSDLTCEELWNITKMGYAPYKLVLGTSIYSLGLVGGLTSFLKSFVKGEITELTSLIYDAREKSLEKIAADAQAIGADDVVGIKTYVYALGSGLIEFLAIGTAVKKVGTGLVTKHDQLIPQAIIRDKDTFINTVETSFGIDLDSAQR